MIKVNRPDTPMTIYFLSCNTGLTLAMLYVIQAVIWWRLSAILCCLFCLRPAGISCSTTWHRCNTWERLKVKIISKDKLNDCLYLLKVKLIIVNSLCNQNEYTFSLMTFAYDLLTCNLTNEMNELSCVPGPLPLRGSCRRWVVPAVRNTAPPPAGLG